MRKVLLDTNAYSSYLAGDKQVLEVLSQAGIVYISIFVLCELHAGFKGGLKEKENLDILNKFLAKPTVQVLDASTETAEIFGMIKNTLKKLGKPLPINDVWIAAHALETGSVFITYDQHFKEIPTLRLWKKLDEEIFVDQIEMDEILANTKLIKRLERGTKEAKAGKGSFVE